MSGRASDKITSIKELIDLGSRVKNIEESLKKYLETIKSDYLDKFKSQLNKLVDDLRDLIARLEEIKAKFSESRDMIGSMRNELRSSIIKTQELIVKLDQKVNDISLKIQEFIGNLNMLNKSIKSEFSEINRQIGDLSSILHGLIEKVDVVSNSIEKTKQEFVH